MFGFTSPSSSRKKKRNVSASSGRSRRSSSFQRWVESVDWGKVRINLVGIVFAIAWFAVWGRVAWVQLLDGQRLADMARRQHVSARLVDIPRGTIWDRNNFALARSVECLSVYANPSIVQNIPAVAAHLSSILGIPQEEIQEKLEKGRHFAWIARRVDDATAKAVRQANLRGIELVREHERIYPYKQLAGQLLGFVGMDGKGLEGIEKAFDKALAGSKSRQLIQRDAKGRPFQVPLESPVSKAEDIRLTLDMQVQFIAEDALARAVEGVRAKWGGILVVDTRKGDVLAWAQYPTFNPNLLKGAKPEFYRNRLALDALEPGSTFKPFTVAAAMQENLINRDTVFDCEQGAWRTRYITIRDDRQSLGLLPVHTIISKSSNIGSAKIGHLLGAKRFHAYLKKLGFGERVGLQLSESRGILRQPRHWSEADLYSTSFGQSISVTAAQLAQAYLILVNDGVYKPLNIVMNREYRLKETRKRVFSPHVCREVLSIMREVVDEGTGKRAAIPGLSVAGKTGTAQKAGRGKYGSERLASFVGITPAEKPRYLCIIMLDEPVNNKYGGAIAAPVFKEVMTRMLAHYGELPAEALPERILPVRKETSRDSPAVPSRRTGRASKNSIPNVIGQPIRQAVEAFAPVGIIPQFKGKGTIVKRQEPPAGTPLPSGKNRQTPPPTCTLWLSETKE